MSQSRSPREISGSADPAAMVDLERYPVVDLDAAREGVEESRRSLARKGVAILPGFLRPRALHAMAREAESLRPHAHLEDAWGTPYLERPDASFPEGHPRRTACHSLTWVVAYDRIPADSPLRALYAWEPLAGFLAEILQRRPLYRMADPLGALNLTLMDEGHIQGWHYDNSDFVVSLAIQASADGGEFECAPFVRSAEDEHYERVERVLQGRAPDLLEVFPMTPGTLMIFAGRRSIHRVSPVRGGRPRIVALLAYDARPGSNSSRAFKKARYGRVE